MSETYLPLWPGVRILCRGNLTCRKQLRYAAVSCALGASDWRKSSTSASTQAKKHGAGIRPRAQVGTLMGIADKPRRGPVFGSSSCRRTRPRRGRATGATWRGSNSSVESRDQPPAQALPGLSRCSWEPPQRRPGDPGAGGAGRSRRPSWSSSTSPRARSSKWSWHGSSRWSSCTACGARCLEGRCPWCGAGMWRWQDPVLPSPARHWSRDQQRPLRRGVYVS